MTSVEPQEGQIGPDFHLPTAEGGSLTLSSLRGRKVVLYFIREFGCGICRKHCLQFGQAYPRFKEEGAEVLVVSPGSPAQAQAFAQQLGLPFRVLADASRSVYRSYGLGRMLGLVQRSEVFLIDEQGVIRFAQGHGLPTRLPEVTEVLAALQELPHEPRRKDQDSRPGEDHQGNTMFR